jgi:hypothetical protein
VENTLVSNLEAGPAVSGVLNVESRTTSGEGDGPREIAAGAVGAEQRQKQTRAAGQVLLQARGSLHDSPALRVLLAPRWGTRIF